MNVSSLSFSSPRFSGYSVQQFESGYPYQGNCDLRIYIPRSLTQQGYQPIRLPNGIEYRAATIDTFIKHHDTLWEDTKGVPSFIPFYTNTHQAVDPEINTIPFTASA